MRRLLMVLGILYSVFAVSGSDDLVISLSGSVEDAEGAALEGVTVSLAGVADLSNTSNAEGKFKLSKNEVSVRACQQHSAINISFKNHILTFQTSDKHLIGQISLYAGNGKQLVAQPFGSQAGQHRVAIPELTSGYYLLKVTLGSEAFTRSLVCMGNDLYLQNSTSFGTHGSSFTLAKQSASEIVDTLIAAKEGYDTLQFPLKSYSQDAIKLVMEEAAGECTRESMKAIVDKYLEAQEAGDPSKMPLADNAVVLENTEEVSAEESILSRSLKIDFNLSIYDVDSCRTFTEVIAAKNSPQYVIGTRLRIKGNKITKINMIVTDKDEWLFNANNYLKYASQQDWNVLPESRRSSREELIDAGNQYLDIFNADDEGAPFGAPCYRIEGGMVTLQESNPNGDYCTFRSQDVLGASDGEPVLISERDFIVDEELSTVDVFCKFCALDSHMFRLVDGHYRYVHTLTVGCD